MSFSMFNVETSNANTKELLWKFVKKYKSKISEKDYPIFDKLVGYAIKYFNDVIVLKNIKSLTILKISWRLWKNIRKM